MNAIVIPTYNERANIGPLLKEINHVLPKTKIIVVDDNSPDGTSNAVRNLIKKYSQVDIITRKNARGRGGACIAGFKYLLKKYPSVAYVVEMDADFSHAPTDIPRLLVAANPDTVIIGSRYIRGSIIEDWPLFRLVLSIIANWYIKLILGVPISDYTMGFRCYSRKALRSINFDKVCYTGFITLSEIAFILKQKGYLFCEIPITLKDRTKGKSNATFSEVIKSFIAVIRIRVNKY